MKKTYVKPMMGFESFELSSSIAGSCAIQANHDMSSCEINIPPFGWLFTYSCKNEGLFSTSTYNSDNDTDCYHGWSYSNIVYTS